MVKKDVNSEGQVSIGDQLYSYSYCKKLGVITVVINDLKITHVEGKALEYQGSLLKYSKVCNKRINPEPMMTVVKEGERKGDEKEEGNHKQNSAIVYRFPHSNFYCYSQDDELYQPVYNDDTNQPELNMLLVNDDLYGSYRDDYNNLTIYHHGLIMNRHVKAGKLLSIPTGMYDLAVILNEIESDLHHILLV
jgi:hypothetical protein